MMSGCFSAYLEEVANHLPPPGSGGGSTAHAGFAAGKLMQPHRPQRVPLLRIHDLAQQGA
jgi:hypothetical protein